MTDNFETEGSFILTYSHPDGDSYRFTFKEPLTWHEALNKFVTFLSNVCGYDLTDQVAILESKTALNRECWNGPTFGWDNDDNAVGLSD